MLKFPNNDLRFIIFSFILGKEPLRRLDYEIIRDGCSFKREQATGSAFIGGALN